MIQSAEKLSNIHFEHLIWHNELQNYLLEIQIYEDRIKALLQQHEGQKTIDELVRFQEKFEELKNHINNWKVLIGKHEYRILEVAKLDGAISLISDTEHDEMRKKIQRLRKSMLKLKEHFQYFLLNLTKNYRPGF